MTGRFDELTAKLADPQLSTGLAPERRPHGQARAAVLMLLSENNDPDLLFTERAGGLRKHAGQISFPGGSYEPGDADAQATALRETWEEVGLKPADVTLLGRLPVTRLPVSSFDVAPVVGTWSGRPQMIIASPDEVAAIHRWRISELADPENRVMARHPGGHTGPAWRFGDLFLWGFTAYLTDALLRLGGWSRRWDRDHIVDVPTRFMRDVQLP
ncbi:MAG: CoA pyrophosphatase [Propionibacterium sp.]|nr:CoA pyrophosphatase [Propionibacterium sp.]